MASDKKKSRILLMNNIKPPVEGRCGYFVQRKQRYCKMLPAKGNKNCAEHLSEEKDPQNNRIRIVCPLDSKHTVFEDKLKQHLKKCNAIRKTQLPCYYKNINLGLKDYHEEETISLYQIPIVELQELIMKVKDCFATIMDNVCLKEQIAVHSVIEHELKVPEYGSSVKKHLFQQASLIDILDKINVLEDNMTILEFGAGRGALSHWIQKAMKGTLNKFLLIDRQHNRNKLDCYHKGEDQGPHFERLIIDIQHLNLGCVQSLWDNQMNITGVGKHLCGGATDLSLRCLFESLTKDESFSYDETRIKKQKFDPIQNRLHAVLFALCCYHRCTWNTYVGTQVLLEKGFTSTDFRRITKMAGWATCGFERRKIDAEVSIKQNEVENLTSEEVFHDELHTVNENDFKRHEELNLTATEQEEIGRMCKRIIDFGRLQYIRNHGYHAELITYIHKDITPENVALCATKSKLVK